MKSKIDKNYMDTKEIEYTTTNDFMTENPDTCINVTNPNRFKKSHWKGMNEEQKAEILRTMQDQMVDKKKKKELEKEAEKLWAEQEEAKRQMLVRMTLEKQKKEQEMNKALLEAQKTQAGEKKTRWGNYYGEKLPNEKPVA